MAKYVLSDQNLCGVEVFESDDILDVEKTMNALMLNDQLRNRDMHYCIVDSETGEVLHFEIKRVDEKGQWQLTWYMTPEVAEVLNWKGILDSRTVKVA